MKYIIQELDLCCQPVFYYKNFKLNVCGQKAEDHAAAAADVDDDDDDGEEEEEEDPMESMGIGANIVMAFVALGFLVLKL